MPLQFLLDENVPSRLWRAIQRHNTDGAEALDVVRVGEPTDLPLSSDDPTILIWAERKARILITEDKHTLPIHLAGHLEAGHHSPGIFLIRPSASIATLIEYLVLVAYASEPEEWQDRIEYVP